MVRFNSSIPFQTSFLSLKSCHSFWYFFLSSSISCVIVYDVSILLHPVRVSLPFISTLASVCLPLRCVATLPFHSLLLSFHSNSSALLTVVSSLPFRSLPLLFISSLSLRSLLPSFCLIRFLLWIPLHFKCGASSGCKCKRRSWSMASSARKCKRIS